MAKHRFIVYPLRRELGGARSRSFNIPAFFGRTAPPVPAELVLEPNIRRGQSTAHVARPGRVAACLDAGVLLIDEPLEFVCADASGRRQALANASTRSGVVRRWYSHHDVSTGQSPAAVALGVEPAFDISKFSNAPMLAINDALGFNIASTRTEWQAEADHILHPLLRARPSNGF
jgi:hypothetical protein